MREYAISQGWEGGNYKKLNLVFENKILGQSREVRERMTGRVEHFVYAMLVDVFNAADTAEYALDAIAEAGSYDLGAKAERLENPGEWTREKIKEKASHLDTDKGPEGDFDD